MRIRQRYDLPTKSDRNKTDQNQKPERKPIPLRPAPRPVQDKKYLIEGLLGEFDSLSLECDGFTRCAHYALLQNGVDHRCFKGSCTVGETVVSLHFWIVAGKYTVDYRLRIWAGPAAPHGIFETNQFPDVQYKGEEILLPMSAVIFEILTGRKSN